MINFDEKGFATEDVFAVVYVCDDQRLLIGSGETLFSKGTGLPASGMYLDPPPDAVEWKAIRRTKDGKSWEYVDDYRGETVYAKDKSNTLLIRDIGEIPDGYVKSPWNTVWDDLIDGEWVLNEEKKHADDVAEATAKRKSLLADAAISIAPLQDATDLDEATEEEAALLKKWKQYRVALNRVDISDAPAIKWPDKPE